MFGKWVPREVGFFDFFDKHAQIIVKSAKEFQNMANTSSHIVESAEKIKALELEADSITHHCDEMLHKTFITPFERDDILRLVSKMDDIVDYIEAASASLVVYKLTQMTGASQDLADILVACTLEVEAAVKRLRHMRNSTEIRQHCIQINRLENEADLILRNAIGELFENEIDARNIIKWKEIYENLENATDRCEDVADIIDGVILEYD